MAKNNATNSDFQCSDHTLKIWDNYLLSLYCADTKFKYQNNKCESNQKKILTHLNPIKVAVVETEMCSFDCFWICLRKQDQIWETQCIESVYAVWHNSVKTKWDIQTYSINGVSVNTTVWVIVWLLEIYVHAERKVPLCNTDSCYAIESKMSKIVP